MCPKPDEKVPEAPEAKAVAESLQPLCGDGYYLGHKKVLLAILTPAITTEGGKHPILRIKRKSMEKFIGRRGVLIILD